MGWTPRRCSDPRRRPFSSGTPTPKATPTPSSPGEQPPGCRWQANSAPAASTSRPAAPRSLTNPRVADVPYFGATWIFRQSRSADTSFAEPGISQTGPCSPLEHAAAGDGREVPHQRAEPGGAKPFLGLAEEAAQPAHLMAEPLHLVAQLQDLADPLEVDTVGGELLDEPELFEVLGRVTAGGPRGAGGGGEDPPPPQGA